MTNIKTLLSAAIIAISFSACSSSEEKSVVEDKAVNVETYLPGAIQDDGIFISGMVSAKQTAVISTRIMGFVDKIYVKQGDVVKQGQLLMVINSDDLKAKKAQALAMVSEAEAAAKNANRDYERYRVLHSKTSVSDKELENMDLNKTSVNARLNVARQGLKEVEAMLAYTNIRAPFSGVVTAKMIDEGSTANPGMPLLNIEQSGDVDVRASVPENYIKYIKVGDAVKVDIKSLNKRIQGHISELSSSAAMNGGQFAVKIAIDPKDKDELKAGMYAGVFIPTKIDNSQLAKSEIWVEQSSIIKRNQLTGVYVVNADNKAMLRWVRTGKKIADRVEILSGISRNDRIIRPNSAKLYNGKKVNITK